VISVNDMMGLPGVRRLVKETIKSIKDGSIE
jgi:hypothetical protein